ncbi:MAG: S-adenosylmethionine:tRNA ribosyltransferase-isomerase, partial [Bryobacteraceae bacterium]
MLELSQPARLRRQRVRAVLPGAARGQAQALNLADFHYELPAERIAQHPLEDRAGSRMLVLDRGQGCWEDRTFRELPRFLRAGDCLVVNDSRVIPARLY